MKAFTALVVSMMLLLAACGNGSETNPPHGYPPEPPNLSIRAYLSDLSEQGDPFSTAVLQTGVLDRLEPDAFYTIFAPPRTWFKQNGMTKEALLAQPQLEAIVAYHFVTVRLGNLEMPFEPDTRLPTLLAGQSISLSQEGERYFLNDEIELLTHPSAFPRTYEADVLEVDELLLPQGVTLE